MSNLFSQKITIFLFIVRIFQPIASIITNILLFLLQKTHCSKFIQFLEVKNL